MLSTDTSIGRGTFKDKINRTSTASKLACGTLASTCAMVRSPRGCLRRDLRKRCKGSGKSSSTLGVQPVAQGMRAGELNNAAQAMLVTTNAGTLLAQQALSSEVFGPVRWWCGRKIWMHCWPEHAKTTLQLTNLPLADTARYDRLRPTHNDNQEGHSCLNPDAMCKAKSRPCA